MKILQSLTFKIIFTENKRKIKRERFHLKNNPLLAIHSFDKANGGKRYWGGGEKQKAMMESRRFSILNLF